MHKIKLYCQAHHNSVTMISLLLVLVFCAIGAGLLPNMFGLFMAIGIPASIFLGVMFFSMDDNSY